MLRRVFIVLMSGLLLAAPAASAYPLPSSATPLSGSTFQGGDGDQDDATPYIDWQALQAAGRVLHAPDDNEQDTAFVGGTKVLQPGDWETTIEAGGVTPDKVNIRDAWQAIDQPGKDTFLYLAFTREDGTGTAAITFELNRDARLWDNGHAKIPCRTTGDILVVTLPQGNRVEIVVAQWTTSTADAATGCAKTGVLQPMRTFPDGAGQGAVNAAPITSRLPGAFALGTQIPTADFSEVALNLSTLLNAAFDDDCFAFASIWMHSRSADSESSNLQDYIAPRPVSVRNCSASGTKFFDLDADGVRDAGEPGLPRFLVWADYDNDGVRDEKEPFAVTDNDGRYVIDFIRPPSGGSYRLREQLATTATRRSAWRCSFPNARTPGGFAHGPGGPLRCGWGPITAAANPNVTGRDFGNWVPARLTVEKQLWPSDDPGRFDLIVNGVTVKAAAGDGDKVTLPVPPGTFNVSESAVAGTDPADYESTVRCRAVTRRRSVLRSGPAWTGLVLKAGDQAECTFTNVRRGPAAVPAIALEKTGPALAEAGETLRYTLYVTNPGEVPFPASDVKVRDDRCDDTPELSDKNGDTSPDTLDPGDTWTYACSHRTPEPDADCAQAVVTNTATATGTANGSTVQDDGQLTTVLTCPEEPVDPVFPIPDPGPEPPFVPPLPGPAPSPDPPFVPPGPRPPDAGAAGTASVSASNVRCVSRASQVQFTGERVRTIRVSVDGRRLGTQQLRLLQRRATPLTRLFAPGRHVLTIRVTYEEGSGTAPVTLRRTIVICGRAPRAPRVTG
jgi:hypothetical protein